MEEEIISAYRKVLSRIYAKENIEKYHSICMKVSNKDEERIQKLCEAFWHPKYSYRTYDAEKCEPNPNLDNTTAKRYLAELTRLLDKLGWYDES